ncbi:4-hydroxybenzoate--CoA ligase [Paraburkholderia caffeinilytica]|uniref:Acetyl-CoA synthetase n=1 Tax=Paraburkholderia caffeinilytica TaxID=1761016 RepID=A0ABQ1LAW3_9BURK|nr:benzoate-CoA ligase family protein [Paraburkholderia caffeinilytica]AXL51418.1 4-hydroxybenzoate--CoA ligase [Paraburkholderia caffeinilytica]GGC21410.1 acetyl-CoA synthetase [Paraburkholderia caffeinilytica]CAB3778062.1 Benzoate--CoA ligase [Paraburkholderia caffeinilytica]
METLLDAAASQPVSKVEPPPALFNFAAYLFRLNESRAAKTAYIDDTGATTYGELEERARRFASALRTLGVHPEERVLLVMLDTVDLPIAFLGALYAGIVPVVANTLLTAADYVYMLTHSHARAVIASGALLPNVIQAMDTAEHDGCQLIVSQPSGNEPLTAPRLADLIDAATPAIKASATGCDDIAFWLYSSGSTGKPKGTVHTHANLYWTAELYAKPILGIVESDVVFSAAKLFFAYGLGNGLTFPLSVGATAVLMAERPTADAIFTRLVRHRPTVFYGVPTLYASMLVSPNLPARADVAMRICTSAGEALPREIGERFTAHFGCDILDGIGSTEMLHIFLSNRAGAVEYGTTGRPVPGYEVELRDEAGHAVPDGEIGDLYIKGPSAALMYWSNREKTRATFLGEWIRSGDKYRRLANGSYVYAGRSDDMLKVSGQYVSPVEVEMVLVQHDAVLEAAVVGVDHGGLVKTRAFVVLKREFAPSEILADELKAFVKERLAPHKYPRDILFIDDLPKTATGKIQRFKLREQS